MNKKYFLLFLFLILFIPNVSALELSEPIIYSKNSITGEQYVATTLSSENAFGYPNWAADFIRNSSNGYNNWYGFVYSGLTSDCDSSVLLKGKFLTWTNYTPGPFVKSPSVTFTNGNNTNYSCSLTLSNNSNVLDFICAVDEMTPTGSFNISYDDPGYVSVNGSLTGNWTSYVGMAKQLDVSCNISTGDVINNQNNNTNNIINNQNQTTQDIINNQNQNSQATQDTIKDQFNECRDSYNLLPSNGITQTINGVTFTKQSDGSVIANGTATAGINYYTNTSSYITFQPGTYTFSDGVTGETTNTYFSFLDGTTSVSSVANSTFTLTESTSIRPRIVVRSGVTLNNVKFSLQIVEGTSTKPYEQYGLEICKNRFDESIENNNQNTQDIINNQNQNFEDLENSINEKFETCKPGKNLFDKNSPNILKNTYIGQYGTAGTATGNQTLYILKLEPNTYYTIQKVLSSRFRVGTYSSLDIIGKTLNNYKSDDSLTKYTIYNENDEYLFFQFYSDSDTLTASEIMDTIMIEKGQNASSYEPFGEVCSNRIDETNDKLNDINNSLTNSSPPDTSGLENSAGWLPPGPVDSILNLPLSLLNNLNDNLSKECQPVNLTLPFVKKTIQLPCLMSIYEQIEGLSLFINSVGIVASAFILYSYLLNLYKWVEDTLTFRENNWSDWGGL